jgi:A nuclease family of the HNH/ENDO VII superfamily with conserved AHH
MALEKCLESGWQCTNKEGSETHHIVAQASRNPNAVAARVILKATGIGINTPPNLVELPYRVHRRLHTNNYYIAVNTILQAAYDPGLPVAENRQVVTSALGEIRAAIESGVFPS